MSKPRWERHARVQRLALTGYDADAARHVVLRVADAGRARAFIAGLLRDDIVTFGDRPRDEVHAGFALDIGFTYRGLQALGVPDHVLDLLATRSPAFREGAPSRAARCLGDAGASAAERWEPRFRDRDAAVWIALHGNDDERIDAAIAALRSRRDADGFAGWDDAPPLVAKALLGDRDPGTGSTARLVHFGFRDNIARPRIDGAGDDLHAPGELLLGYVNDEGFDLWSAAKTTPTEVADFLRDGSFGVLRKIEQDEAAFSAFLRDRAAELQPSHPFADENYLKAKLCGRWADGELVQPRATSQGPGPHRVEPVRDAAADPMGLGCPFGAHVRRTNPRNDPISPPRQRTLFRRGLPYGRPFAKAPQEQRGLMGVFFCASIEDQFERLVSEWVEKNPMGPPNRGRARDPLIGHHDDPDAEFHIPQSDGAPIVLKGFDTPFVTTRGTLYALFPSRAALQAIAGAADRDARATAAAASGTSAAAAPAADPGGADALDPGDAPSDRFCDIVMEGGITSGIIYATAVTELARRYRFRNVGGSSIGAFAAAVTAAAEYRRRKGSNDGFAALERLPETLAEEEGGRTLLERLFVPQSSTRRLYEIFVAALNRSSWVAQLGWGLRAALRQYRGPVVGVGAVLLAAVLAGPLLAVLGCASCAPHPFVFGAEGLATLIPALLLALTVAVCGAIAAAIAWDLLRGLVPNGFGLCRGWDPDATAATLDLAGFLHASIQQAAGRDPLADPCLTFADLWEAPGAPCDVLGFEARGVAARSINLEVYTTNLTHARPYRFPLDEAEDMGRLFFRIEDFRNYFPLPVLIHLQRVAVPYRPKTTSDPPAGVGAGYLEMPVGDLPIVVAVRLAMSFPLLICAVPVYAVDYEQARANRSLAKCWMSDGGLCSNFPIHLFDSFVPKWPTFGISLQTRGKLRPTEGVWLPEFHLQGRADAWNRSLDDDRSAPARLGGFVASLWLAAWHWNDSTMMRMPGVRDRVVRVYLRPGEGGVNIRMSAAQIRKLAGEYGRAAGRAFLNKFAYPQAPGWTEHRWVRINALLIALRDRIEGLGAAARIDHHTLPLARQIADAAYEAPLRGSGEKPLDPLQVNELSVLLAALESLEERFERVGSHHPYRAVPRPSLRVRHPT